MDKYDRNKIGYKIDYPDGLVETIHISLLDSPKQLWSNFSRVLEIKNRLVIVPKFNKDWSISKTEFIELSQVCFFEVNEVINFIPNDE